MPYDSICVLGLGYIGLPTAATFATHGKHVVGVDTNIGIVEGLQNGKVHLYEPGISELVQNAMKTGSLSVCQYPKPADAFIIAVPTPFKDGKKADLSFVISAAESIARLLVKGNLVILESTSPPRTTVDILAPILESSGLKAGIDFLLAYSPERVLPGRIIQELTENARVIGGINQASAHAGKALYSAFVKGEIFLTDATTAEMVKLMENTFRDINIAAANEFARLAEGFKVDVWEAIELANRHPRVNILSPGPGVGGHCISVDPWFFVEAAPDTARLIRTAREVNDSQPDFVVEFIKNRVGTLTGKKITVLGLAYKPDVDDLRESPAIEISRLLADAGAIVMIYEPFKPDFKIIGCDNASSLDKAVRDADILVLLVKHTQFTNINPADFRAVTQAPIAIDTVNGWQKEDWQNAGFQFFRCGNGSQ